ALRVRGRPRDTGWRRGDRVRRLPGPHPRGAARDRRVRLRPALRGVAGRAHDGRAPARREGPHLAPRPRLPGTRAGAARAARLSRLPWGAMELLDRLVDCAALPLVPFKRLCRIPADLEEATS